MIAYTHISLDLNVSKLQSRSVKVIFLGYYDYEGYKLLEQSTNVVFRSRNIIFEKGTTNFTIQTNLKQFSKAEDIFDYVQTQQSTNIYERKENDGKQTMFQQTIALQLQDITELHKPISESKNLDDNKTDIL